MMSFLRAVLLVVCAASVQAAARGVRTGSQMLRDEEYSALAGHRVAILSNPTGVFPDTLQHIVDVTAARADVDVVAIFGPEHGFRGELQAETGDPLEYQDSATGLPVFSVYKMTDEAIAALIIEMNITTVLVDMQDVGVRLYTFIWTMYNVMEASFSVNAGRASGAVRMVICDRPNPLGGEVVDGPLLNMSCCSSGYGKASITHVHGMTMGELSLLFQDQLMRQYQTQSASVEVVVYKMDGWERSMSWADTQLPWVPPSPNVPTVQTAVAYPATCFLEATTVAEGRGTTTPFEQFGAPFLPSQGMAAYLNDAFNCTLAGNCFRAAYFQPTFSKYNNTAVPAVQWMHERLDLKTPSNADMSCTAYKRTAGDDAVMPRPTSALFEAGVRILVGLKGLAQPPEAFVWDGSWFGHPGTELIDEYAGTPALREMIDAEAGVDAIVAAFAEDVREFTETRKRFLIYA